MFVLIFRLSQLARFQKFRNSSNQIQIQQIQNPTKAENNSEFEEYFIK